MSITLAFAVAQVSLYFNCHNQLLSYRYLDYFYYFVCLIQSQPFHKLVYRFRDKRLYEINFDYFYFTSSQLLKNDTAKLLCFRFERTNLNSARATHICYF